MAEILLEQLKKKQNFIFEESINFHNSQFFFFSERKKKYSYTPTVNKKEYLFLEKHSINKNIFTVPILNIKNSKISILESVLRKKFTKKKPISILKRSIGLSCVLKRVKGGLLLNSANCISFIPFSFYEEKLNYLGKNILLKLTKLKLVKYDHKFFFSYSGTRKSLMFKFNAILKKLLKKRLVYNFFPGRKKKIKSLHVFCGRDLKLKIKLLKETVMSL